MKPWLVLALLLVLSGCTLLRPSAPPQGEALSWQAQQEKNRLLDNWQIRGKIGIRAPRESGSANLFWQQNQDYFDIRLAGPLGRGAARLLGTKEQARLEAAGDITSGKAQSLLDERLGWGLPLEELIWWLRGLPAPGKTTQLQLNSDNRLMQLKQQGWQIDYPSYRLEQGYWLPEKIKINGHELVVTLVIKEWDLTPPSPLPQPLSRKRVSGASFSPLPLMGEGTGERATRSTMPQTSRQ